MRYKKTQYQYHLMLLPVMVFLLIFSILPMFGVTIAFQKFLPAKGLFGSKFVGLKNFRFMFEIPDSWQVLKNTVIIAVSKMVFGLIVPVVFSLLLNEIRNVFFKRTIQTAVYLPHFLSWVVLAVPIMNIFAYDGIINQIVMVFGGEPIQFLASNRWFRQIMVITDVWKGFGFGTIVYLAAITAISPNLYEAAVIDGASRWKQTLYVTLPGMISTIVLMATLSLGNVLNAGFDQIYNLYTPLVYETGDIIDTYVYRIGLLQMNYSLGTAVGMMKSVVSMVLIIISYTLAYKFADYRVF